MKLTYRDRRYIAISTYDERAVPKTAGFRWDAAAKLWYTTEQATAAKLAQYADDTCRAALARAAQVRTATLAASRATDADIDVPAPDGLAYLPFQRAGIAFAVTRQGVLYADEMGLGKTIQAIGEINADPNPPGKILVICPASLKINWSRELARWLTRPCTIAIANGGAFPEDAGVTIINYDLLRKHSAAIHAREWDRLIIDEAHYLKTPTAARTQEVFGTEDYAAKKLAAAGKADKIVQPIRARKRRALTGTPIPNRPREAYPILHYLDPTTWPNAFGFYRRYCAAAQTKYGWDFDGSSHLDELQEKLRTTCFYYDTMVECEEGPIAIGEIVENAKPVRVLCVNAETAEVSWRQVIAHSKSVAPSRMVRVQHEVGEFTCTPDHPIWTAKGWVRAEALATGMSLLVLRDGVRGATQQRQLLQHSMCCSTPREIGSSASEEQRQAVPCPGLQDPKGLSGMRNYFLRRRELSQVLQPGMRRSLELSADARLPGSQEHAREDTPPYREDEGCCSSAGRAVERGPLAIINTREVIREPEGELEATQGGWRFPTLPNANRARALTEEADAGAVGAGNSTWVDGRGNGGAYRDERAMRIRRFADRQADHRGRRGNSRTKVSATCGQREGHGFAESRILCIESMELGSRGQSPSGSSDHRFVYDLEVAGTHTFFADGVLVHNCMIRRLKRDVLTELPPKRRSVIELPPNGCAGAIAAEHAAWDRTEARVQAAQAAAELAKASDDPADYEAAVLRLREAVQAAFTEISLVRHDTAVAKVPAVIEHITDALESVDKLVLFSHHHDVSDAILAALTEAGIKAVMHRGDLSADAKQAAVDAFQTNPAVRVFLGSIQASGVGITLTAASHVIFAELDWVPGNVTQAEDRCHRIGQHDSVNVEHLVLDGSLDARMAHILVAKQTVIDQALDKMAAAEPAAPTREQAATSDTPPSRITKLAESLTDGQRAAAHAAVRILAGLDPDHAGLLNDAGFNRLDGRIGHELAERATLSPRQAALAWTLVQKYRRQLGPNLMAALKGETPSAPAAEPKPEPETVAQVPAAPEPPKATEPETPSRAAAPHRTAPGRTEPGVTAAPAGPATQLSLW